MADELRLLSQLGKRITYLRKERGISQLDLSIDSGLSKSYLSDLEHGRRNPSVASLSKIASALGVTLEELFRGVVEIKQLIDN
ncbi:MAG: helix-turn-helix transcriptional regulator [Bacillota bacterium]|nr:helix-turn-helix transcriptional regulator [Bacillota bacterium]